MARDNAVHWIMELTSQCSAPSPGRDVPSLTSRCMQGSGMSVMEMSHRGKEFVGIAAEAEADLRTLLSIPDNYKVIFMQARPLTHQLPCHTRSNQLSSTNTPQFFHRMCTWTSLCSSHSQHSTVNASPGAAGETVHTHRNTGRHTHPSSERFCAGRCLDTVLGGAPEPCDP